MTDYARWRDAFAQAMDERLYNIAYLDSLVANMRAQCWFGDNSALVTQLRPFPTGALAIEGIVAAGDKDEIVNVLTPKAERWGKDMAGCQFAMLESREGWEREFRPSGYRRFQVSLIKEL